jgi:hypothetical protein
MNRSGRRRQVVTNATAVRAAAQPALNLALLAVEHMRRGILVAAGWARRTGLPLLRECAATAACWLAVAARVVAGRARVLCQGARVRARQGDLVLVAAAAVGAVVLGWIVGRV